MAEIPLPTRTAPLRRELYPYSHGPEKAIGLQEEEEEEEEEEEFKMIHARGAILNEVGPNHKKEELINSGNWRVKHNSLSLCILQRSCRPYLARPLARPCTLPPCVKRPLGERNQTEPCALLAQPRQLSATGACCSDCAPFLCTYCFPCPRWSSIPGSVPTLLWLMVNTYMLYIQLNAQSCTINTLHLIPEPCRINKETALEHVIAQCRTRSAHIFRFQL